MKESNIEEFKNELEMLLVRYNASITTSKALCLMEYSAITFVLNGTEYWSVDEAGFAESIISAKEAKNITIK